MFDWSDIRVFLAVVEERSALAAARRLHTNQTTVSRRIERLEQALKLRLFEKNTRGYVLTRNGAALVDLAESMNETAKEIQNRSSSMIREVSGTIRFSGNVTTMRIYGSPMIAMFREQHSNVVFEVDTQNRKVSLEKNEADIAMRSTDEVVGDSLIARKFDEQPWALYCSHDYATSHGHPGNLEDCASHAIVAYSDVLADKIRCLRWLRDNLPSERTVLRVDSTMGMSSTLRTSAGVGALPRVLGDNIPELRYCFGHPKLMHPIWIVASQESYATPLVRTFLKFFADNFDKVRVVY